MENNPNPITLSGENLALTLKIYKENAARIVKKMNAVETKKKKLEAETENLKKELEEQNALIDKVSGKESTNEVVKIIPEIVTTLAPAITQTYPGYEKDSFGIDVSGYNQSFKWEEKLDYVLKNAPKALKKEDITKILRAIDKKINERGDKELFPTIIPYLSRMTRNKIT